METSERGWDYSIQRLIANGHDVDKIPGYTYKQFGQYIEAVDAIEKDKLQMQLAILRLSKMTDAKAFEKFRKELFSE